MRSAISPGSLAAHLAATRSFAGREICALRENMSYRWASMRSRIAAYNSRATIYLAGVAGCAPGSDQEFCGTRDLRPAGEYVVSLGFDAVEDSRVQLARHDLSRRGRWLRTWQRPGVLRDERSAPCGRICRIAGLRCGRG